MKLALYVHDLRLEIGHSNSLIELIRHLPAEEMARFSEIEVVSFTTTPLKELFPTFTGKLSWSKVPFKNLKPVLAKSIFYQLWVWFHNRFRQKGEVYRIGIGISSLDVDAVSIQFIHHQWTEKGLEMESGHFLRKIYKKILFAYFEWCENFLLPSKGLRVFSPAEFLTKFIQSRYPGVKAATVYSGVNLDRFQLNQKSKKEIFDDVVTRYPSLQGLDVTKPVYLFVGAYERKGLDEALALLKAKPGSQFIVVGSPSMGRTVDWPSEIKVFTVTFTREVSNFYSLADVFIFPTLYEPFGLVLFEAMAMGLSIITRESLVGASELLKGLPEVYFTDHSGFSMPEISVMSVEDKRQLREKRLVALGDVSWNKAGRELANFLQASL